LASLRARPLAASCAHWLSRLAISARAATISLVSSVLSPSRPRTACWASANSRPNSSPALSNSAARFSSALNSLRTLSWLPRSSASALRKPTLSLFSCSSACSAEPDGLDEVAEGFFEIIERADPTVGIDQQIAQRLVLLADAGADVGQCRLARLFGGG